MLSQRTNSNEAEIEFMSSRYNSLKSDLLPQPSTGRRERKKLKQKNEIISVAISHFIEHGYEETNMQNIAESADVAVSTLYKYFPTKRHLLLAVHETFVEDMSVRLKDYIPDLDGNVVDIIMEQTQVVWGAPMTAGERRLWCNMRAASFLADTPEAGAFYDASRQRYANMIHDLLVRLRDRGAVSHLANLRTLAAAIHAIRLQGFSRYLIVQELALDTVVADTREQIEAAMAGWLSVDGGSASRRASKDRAS